MKLNRVDVSAYSNNAIRKHDGRFYMAHEADAEIERLRAEAVRLREVIRQLVQTGSWREELDDVVAFALVTGNLRDNV